MSKIYIQSRLNKFEYQEIAQLLRNGAIGVFSSDTIYGIYTSAFKKVSIEKIYELRKRDKDKPMIVLISSLSQLALFNINLTPKMRVYLEKNWPNPLSVVFDCPVKDLEYLHRGLNTLAIRMPKLMFLQQIIEKSGPLVAPSANFAGEIPAKNISEAKKYFGDYVDFYIDGGELKGEASTIIKFNKDNKIEILRQGAHKIPS